MKKSNSLSMMAHGCAALMHNHRAIHCSLWSVLRTRFAAVTIACALILLTNITLAQNESYPRYDYNWILGYGEYYNSPESYNTFKLSFSSSPPTIEAIDSSIDMKNTNASISDADGNLLCYTNGLSIFKGQYSLIEDGDSIALNLVSYQQSINSGLNISQAALILPKDEDSYYVIHEEYSLEKPPIGYSYGVPRCYATIVDMTANGNLGRAVSRNQVIVDDTLKWGHLAACRHANGRDWWLLVPKWGGCGKTFRLLVTPDSIIEMSSLEEPMFQWHDGGGQASFSEDGSKYMYSYGDFDYGSFVIHDFDRCEGVFTNTTLINYEDVSVVWGANLSPNGRYLYAFADTAVWQYDTEALDIEASRSTVAVYDSFYSDFHLFRTKFGHGQIGPDGKIYISTGNTTRAFHIIHNPDMGGMACNLEQHGLPLVYMNKNLPNLPNYRLGPIDGSSCDTLGIDNHPKAFFRYSRDTLIGSWVQFTDLSAYAPTAWSWDFGDGSLGSTDENPAHLYAQVGVYPVCLTVSNANSSDTWCQDVVIDSVSAISVAAALQGISVAPNPCTDAFNITLPKSVQNATLTVYDVMGNRVLEQAVFGYFINKISIGQLPSGTYLYEIKTADGQVQSGKVVRL